MRPWVPPYYPSMLTDYFGDCQLLSGLNKSLNLTGEGVSKDLKFDCELTLVVLPIFESVQSHRLASAHLSNIVSLRLSP